MGTIANLSDTTANAAAASIAPLMNSGLIQIYSGPQPANANTAITGANTLLVTLVFSTPAFNLPPTGGSIVANAITSGTAIAAGLGTFARILQSNASTVVMDVTVGEAGGGAYITLSVSTIVPGGLISITSFSFNLTET